MPSPPGEEDPRLAALRLGWVLAEARGRYILGEGADPRPQDLPARIGHALPLADERSAPEQRIEVEHVLFTLLQPYNDKLPPQANCAAIQAAAIKLHATKGRATSTPLNALLECFYVVDKTLQDIFAAGPFGTSSAYQLGRCVSEIYWALDPRAAPDHINGWRFLLGSHRVGEVEQLTDRLASVLHPMTIQAVRFSVGEWARVAADEQWRSQPDAHAQLYVQAQRWRNLLVGGQDPEAFVAPASLLWRARQIRPVLTAFLPEILWLLAGVTGLTVAADVLKGDGGGHGLATVFAVLGSFGVTTAGVAARAKNTAHDVMTHLRESLYLDLVNAAVTIIPESPKGLRTSAGSGRRG